MVRQKLTTIVTSECTKCKYCTVKEESKSIIKIACAAHNKTYNYGQRIECDDFEKLESRN